MLLQRKAQRSCALISDRIHILTIRIKVKRSCARNTRHRAKYWSEQVIQGYRIRSLAWRAHFKLKCKIIILSILQVARQRERLGTVKGKPQCNPKIKEFSNPRCDQDTPAAPGIAKDRSQIQAQWTAIWSSKTEIWPTCSLKSICSQAFNSLKALHHPKK